MTYRALLPVPPDQTGDDTLQKTVERLLLKTDEACPRGAVEANRGNQAQTRGTNVQSVDENPSGRIQRVRSGFWIGTPSAPEASGATGLGGGSPGAAANVGVPSDAHG